MGGFALRGDEVGDGFGLCQVEFAVHKCPSGELTRKGQPCAVLDEEFEESLLDEDGAVDADLGSVLTRERVWCLEKGHHGFVEGHLRAGSLVRPDDLTVVSTVAFNLIFSKAFSLEQATHDAVSLWT